MATIRLVASGHVQGVGFRWHVASAARALGVSGWVRNADDGSVEVLASGPLATLDALEAAVREGPPGSAVDRVMRVPHGGDAPAGPFHIAR